MLEQKGVVSLADLLLDPAGVFVVLMIIANVATNAFGDQAAGGQGLEQGQDFP